MNWLDIVILVWLGMAAFKGFSNGFIREVASLVAWVAGIWAATHLNERVNEWLGLDPDQVMISILVTFLLVLWGVQLLGKAMTTAVDVALLSIPNKLAGLFFGVLSKAFVLSVLLNLAFAMPQGLTGRVNKAVDHSIFAGPLRSFAPLLVPALRETKWMKKALDRVQKEVEQGM